MKMIFVAYYDIYDSKVNRKYVTSAVNKINYMLKMFSNCGCRVKLFSCSENISDSFKYIASENKVINDSLDLFFPASWGGKSRILRRVQNYWILFSLFLYLLKNAKKNVPVLVYHSTEYKNVILWAKKIIGFKLILDVEEIYSDVQEQSNSKLVNYEQTHIKAADAFLLSTCLLESKVNSGNKPCMVINGTYEVEEIKTNKFQDGKIHIVYAGTFDPRKGGIDAIYSAEYLPKTYHLHICGFGSPAEIQNVKNLINEVQVKSECKISYEGLLTGNDYIEFIQKCHIGLSPQNPESKFNNTSFPSKILSYLSNGLEVVSIKIPAIENSVVGNHLYYYDEQTPSSLARAITSIKDFNGHRCLIESLDKQAQSEFTKLINQLFINE